MNYSTGDNGPQDPAARTGTERALQVLIDVLPKRAQLRTIHQRQRLIVELGGQQLEVEWIGEGRLRQVNELLSRSMPPSIVVGRQLSPGAKAALSNAGIGWGDETGAAEIAVGTVIVSRPGLLPTLPPSAKSWSAATFSIAEALLCGSEATVAATRATTGLSTGSCARALHMFAELGMLDAESPRGRRSRRRVTDSDRLLETYSQAVHEASYRQVGITVGVVWQDIVAGVVETGRIWDDHGISWAATGTVASAVIAPLLTDVGRAEVYIDAKTTSTLEATAATAGLKMMPAGRLTLRPFPSKCTRRLAQVRQGVRTAPWPRVYADLRRVGVRGEEAAEHLRSIAGDL